MDKYIEIIKNLSPNRWALIVGILGMAYGSVGTLFGVTVLPGEERTVFFTGAAFFMVGLIMASIKKYMESKK